MKREIIDDSNFATYKPIDLTAERLQAITWAFVNHLEQKISKFEDLKVAVGYDSRISS